MTTPSPTSTGTTQSIATASSVSNPTTTSGNNDNNNSSGDLFSGNGSPPLILAFLAVGLFAAVMTGVLGWRRLRSGNGIYFPPETGFGPRSKDFGKEPELYEYWISTKNDIKCWDEVVPLAASVLESNYGRPSSPSDSIDSPHHLLHSHPLFQYVRRKTAVSNNKGKDIECMPDEEDELSELQVAFAVAMPCPPKDKSRQDPSSTANLDEDEDVLQYSLGLLQLPWRRTGKES